MVKLAASLNSKVIIGMPAYNEVGRIENFIRELIQEVIDVELSFIVVEDASTDSTYESLEALSSTGINLTVHRNSANQGHGPSTIKALELAVERESDCILMIDGDGHFNGHEVHNILTFFLANHFDVVEGVRVHRGDPVFRKIVSSITRHLIAHRSGHRPGDANTPLRLYKIDTAKLMLARIPKYSLIPNLHISSLTRTMPIRFTEFQIKPFVRITSMSQSIPPKREFRTSWKPNLGILPNFKFIKFCFKAASEWISTNKTK